MIIFINMVSFHEIYPFVYPPNDDPLLAIEFVESSTSSSGACISNNIYYLPHSPLSEASYFDFVLSIFDLSEDDHSYLPILK